MSFPSTNSSKPSVGADALGLLNVFNFAEMTNKIFVFCRITDSIDRAHVRNVDYDMKKRYMLVSMLQTS